MGSYQTWSCHVTQAKNLSFPYLKSYCPLNFRKSRQISWFCYIPNRSYKEDNLKEGRISPLSCGIGLSTDANISVTVKTVHACPPNFEDLCSSLEDYVECSLSPRNENSKLEMETPKFPAKIDFNFHWKSSSLQTETSYF